MLDVIVLGGGHAGVEAALACARVISCAKICTDEKNIKRKNRIDILKICFLIIIFIFCIIFFNRQHRNK